MHNAPDHVNAAIEITFENIAGRRKSQQGRKSKNQNQRSFENN